MILGSFMAHLLLATRAGIRCPGFFGVASDCPSVLDLVSASSEDSGGAGATGGTTGMAVEHSSTTTNSSRTAETLVTRGSTMVISATVTSATAASITEVTSTMAATRSMEAEHTPVRSVALITAAMPEAFPPAGGRAVGAA